MRVDLAKNVVVRVYALSGVTRPWSFVDEVRFNGPNAYLTDAGHPGLIVLDLNSGKGRRVLDRAADLSYRLKIGRQGVRR